VKIKTPAKVTTQITHELYVILKCISMPHLPSKPGGVVPRSLDTEIGNSADGVGAQVDLATVLFWTK
jgi:hypothetical protein